MTLLSRCTVVGTTLLFFSCLLNAGTPSRITTPVERVSFAHVTSYDSLQSFLRMLNGRPGFTVEPIAVTKQGRTVSVVTITSSKTFGSDPKKLRVLLFAQQHGDEPSGKEALTLLLAKFANGEHADWLNVMDLLIVPQMNPDGGELRQRRTSDSVDLNRTHFSLFPAETRGLHDLFYRWMPQVNMDIHEYMSGKEWADSGIAKRGDAVLGVLTHPNAPQEIVRYETQTVFPALQKEVQAKGFRYHEYLVGSPDTRIRRSTTELNDGRQSIGILGTLSFIQEGLKWGSVDDTLWRRATAQLTGVEALLGFCAAHTLEIMSMVENARKERTTLAGTPVSLRNERELGTEVMKIPVWDLKQNAFREWTVTPFQSKVVTYLSAPMPAGYIIPKRLTPVIDWLTRHHVAFETVSASKSVKAEQFRLDSIATEIWEEDPKAAAVGSWSAATVTLQPGDVIVRTNQIQSVTLAVGLEPQSVWGLIGYAAFAPLLQTPGIYPIARMLP